ncbi:major facilitator superfamily domain-containing protein [Dipodascopsis uninucleata]
MDNKGFSTREPEKSAEISVIPKEISIESVEQNDYDLRRREILESFSAEEEKNLMRRVDNHLIYILGLVYLIKQIDVSNASSVKVLQVGEPSNILNELKISSNQYNWVSSIYYFTYIFGEAPSNLLLKKFSPHNWQARILFSWGAILACHAAVHNLGGILAARVFLGLAECGLFPGMMTQFASWYRSDEMFRPVIGTSAIVCAATIVGSLICYGVSYMDGVAGISAWRWVFLLEGIFSMLFAGVVWYTLPDYPKSPRSSKWLTPREQEFLEIRLSENAPRTYDRAFDKKEILQSLKSPYLWSFMMCQMFTNLGGYGLSFATLPKNQLLNIPPAVSGAIGILAAGWYISRSYTTRPPLIMFIIIGMMVSFILLFTLSSPGGIYAACIIGNTFYNAYFVPFWAWRSATMRGATGTAFSYGLQNGIGQVGGIVGPQLFRSKWAYNRYKVSFGICASFVIVSVGFNLYTWYLTRNIEYDVLRVARLRKEAEREGRVYSDDDIKVFEQRQYYKGFRRISTPV